MQRGLGFGAGGDSRGLVTLAVHEHFATIFYVLVHQPTPTLKAHMLPDLSSPVLCEAVWKSQVKLVALPEKESNYSCKLFQIFNFIFLEICFCILQS